MWCTEEFISINQLYCNIAIRQCMENIYPSKLDAAPNMLEKQQRGYRLLISHFLF